MSGGDGGDARPGVVKLGATVHEAEEGGWWAWVPAIPGCATQGETVEELVRNLRGAVAGCLAADGRPPQPHDIQIVV